MSLTPFFSASSNLTKEIGIFKSFTARQILDYLQEKQRQHLLEQFHFYKAAHKEDRSYQLWEEGFHPVLIQNEAMLRERLDYMHNNPVRRGYVEDPRHWRYSSARNYAGMEALLTLKGRW